MLFQTGWFFRNFVSSKTFPLYHQPKTRQQLVRTKQLSRDGRVVSEREWRKLHLEQERRRRELEEEKRMRQAKEEETRNTKIETIQKIRKVRKN